MRYFHCSLCWLPLPATALLKTFMDFQDCAAIVYNLNLSCLKTGKRDRAMVLMQDLCPGTGS